MTTDSDSGQNAVTSAASDAYFAGRQAVIRLAEAGGAEIREKHTWPGSLSMTRYAEPLAGLRAARTLRDTAARVEHDYVRSAREEGAGWQEIGEALGLAQDAERSRYDVATAAYEHAAGESSPWHQSYFGWTCPACEQTIADRGPYESHPEDNEQGHAEGCARLAADVAAWQAEHDAWEAGS